MGGRAPLSGVFLAIAFLCLALGFVAWSLGVLPQEQVTDVREETQAVAADRTTLPRERFLQRMLYAALGVLGIGALFPLRSLAPSFGVGLAHTKWTRGARVVDGDGKPVRAATVSAGEVITVFPQGWTGDASSATLLLRVPREVAEAQSQHPALVGLLAFSKVCTHAGCPVGLYRQDTHQLLCPCHQSVFDVVRNAEPVAGPATRPLPRLAVMLDSDGYLRAQGDFAEPVGPSFWPKT